VGNIAFLLAAALAGAFQAQPLVVVSTGKSLDAFGTCFAQAQEQAGRPWAFAASERGGSFTNDGANGVSAAYRIQFTRAGAVNQLRLYADRRTDAPALVKAVDRCR
jgi:hypothetical protein